ncbi:MAG: hypothetical protein A2086_01735 [Spirochaetes bacterium GWD1_27_9]|nr:MAG: hypothetical protein A2Z98_03995 [Spirochaetes bacterium GWB1_27_13]OHD20609.1 MAG: hypothetical protein A2Y34_17475 [Spirochaetes bacterium GWC1_27_15]OHD41824.1 MAG: hypothetical protein A2086_01735 [Spirochaetes bacterium GWD1_27_9]
MEEYNNFREILFRGLVCYLFYSNLNIPNNYQEYKRYDIRHDDANWSLPLTLEKRVKVNYYGTILSPSEISLENGDWSELSKNEQNIFQSSIF